MKKNVFVTCIAVFSALLATSGYADIRVGKPLPSLAIPEKGELVLIDNKIQYRPWHSSALANDSHSRVHIVQYLAGRLSASKLNEPFTDQLDAKDYPTDKHLVTTIINTSDALWGTAGFVTSELKSNKIRHPHASLVADSQGIGAKTWQLKPQGSAVAVVAPSGEVLFYKDGVLNRQEIDQVLSLVEQYL